MTFWGVGKGTYPRVGRRRTRCARGHRVGLAKRMACATFGRLQGKDLGNIMEQKHGNNTVVTCSNHEKKWVLRVFSGKNSWIIWWQKCRLSHHYADELHCKGPRHHSCCWVTSKVVEIIQWSQAVDRPVIFSMIITIWLFNIANWKIPWNIAMEDNGGL